MKPTPPGWPRISSALTYRDAAGMIDWLCNAFDFVVRLKVVDDDGHIKHSELTYGDAVIMVSREIADDRRFGTAMKSPLSLGATTQSLMIYVDDADAHCAKARAAGARIVQEPAIHDYGKDYWADRSYGALDPEGHLWWITERLRNPET